MHKFLCSSCGKTLVALAVVAALGVFTSTPAAEAGFGLKLPKIIVKNPVGNKGGSTAVAPAKSREGCYVVWSASGPIISNNMQVFVMPATAKVINQGGKAVFPPKTSTRGYIHIAVENKTQVDFAPGDWTVMFYNPMNGLTGDRTINVSTNGGIQYLDCSMGVHQSGMRGIVYR